MKTILSEKLRNLAKNLPAPLYVVGGFTRDYLADLHANRRDVDLCAPTDAETFVAAAQKSGFTPLAVYKHTGTVKLTSSDGEDYEFASFRSDKYVRGTHTPVEIFFTDDIRKDALRRDFTANAVYYDIKAEKFVDPLGGIKDIEKRRMATVDAPNKVFGEDGLRLLRLARQVGQTGFTASEECLQGAKANAQLILDVVPERIFAELSSCLYADKKYNVKNGHYRAFKTLEEIGLIQLLFPALYAGHGLVQRSDFHDHDVLEHSLRALLYADEKVRLAALLHDVGKPIATLRDGNSHAHPTLGEAEAREILQKLRAPKKLTEKTCELILWHMYDFDGKTKENKLRRFFVEHRAVLDELMLLKQADYSGCKDDLSLCPTNRKWQKILDDMKRENAPTSLKELRIKGDEIAALGAKKEDISGILHELLLHAVVFPADNENGRLKKLSLSKIKAKNKEKLS